MIHLPEIPFEVDPKRMAQDLGLSVDLTTDFVSRKGGLFKPAGVFDQVQTSEFFGPEHGIEPETWGPEVIIGACTLGPGLAENINRSSEDRVLWDYLAKSILQDSFDFLKYRISLYLKPTGVSTGDLLLTGCEEIPLSLNRPILDHFNNPRHNVQFDLQPGPSGQIDEQLGVIFIFTTRDRDQDGPSRCASCSRMDCPARLEDIKDITP